MFFGWFLSLRLRLNFLLVGGLVNDVIRLLIDWNIFMVCFRKW